MHETAKKIGILVVNEGRHPSGLALNPIKKILGLDFNKTAELYWLHNTSEDCHMQCARKEEHSLNLKTALNSLFLPNLRACQVSSLALMLPSCVTQRPVLRNISTVTLTFSDAVSFYTMIFLYDLFY